MPRRSIRVVLADDHALMRRSLRALLDHEDGIEVVAGPSDYLSLCVAARIESQVRVSELVGNALRRGLLEI